MWLAGVAALANGRSGRVEFARAHMTGAARRSGLFVVLITTLLCCGPAAPAAAADQPIDTLTVNTQSTGPTTGTEYLHSNVSYKLVVSGTMTDPYGNTYDALYCVGGPTVKGCPTRAATIYAGTKVTGGYFDWRPIDAFQQPSPNTACGASQCPGGLPYEKSDVYTLPTFYPPADGPLIVGTNNQFTDPGAGAYGSGTFTIKIYETRPAVKLSGIARRVDVQLGGGAWFRATAGLQLHEGDKINTGWKASVTLTLPDGSTLVLAPMSLLIIEKLDLGADGSLKAHVFLRLGDVRAQVQKLIGSASDFIVRTPTTTASVRGTVFSVYYDGTTTIVSVTVHAVAVTPNSGKTVVVPAGKEVASSASKVGPIVAIGRAGAPPGSVGPAKALSILTKGISHGIAACKADIYSTTLRPAAHGWNAELQLVGYARGTANWTITGTTLKTANALATRIAHGCPGASLALSWTGTWHTTAGTMHLSEKVSQVTGTFAACMGKAKITGKASGIALDGAWSDPCRSRGGRIHFAFNPDGNSFTGKWSYGSAAPSSPWNGTRN